MIQLLYTLLVGEGAVVLLLILKNPMRMMVTMCLDRVKRGRGPVVVSTLVGVLFVLMVSSLHSIFKIQERASEFGTITPTDQVLMSKHMLESSLMGFCIFLALMIDRMHHYIREIRMMRKAIETKQRSSEDASDDGSTDAGHMDNELSSLREKVKRLQAEAEAKEKEAKTAKADAKALKKQSDAFILEHNRLLEDNKNLRRQLESFEGTSSHSNIRKNL